MKDRLQDVCHVPADAAGPSHCPCGAVPISAMAVGGRGAFLRCRVCDLVARARLPLQEELDARYRDDYWSRFQSEQTGTARDNVHEHALDWLMQVHPEPGMVVDVGCGAGSFLARCRERGWRGLGVDPCPSAVAHATAKGLEAYVRSWPSSFLASETADAVTFINVLDHLRDPFGALQEAWRVLRAGGLLYIRVPNGALHARLIAVLSVIGFGGLPVVHLYGFSRAAFRFHLPRLGFVLRAIRTAPPSQGDAYGAENGSGSAAFRRFLKKADQVLYAALAGSGLDRLPVGPSIEVMAVKAPFPVRP
jgi:SAM-dependent methyltransferase